MTAAPTASSAPAAAEPLPPGRRRLGLDRVELAVLAALAVLSVAVLAALLTKRRALTGADGLLASDQLQYLTWIRQASEHGLIGNEYDMRPDQRVFLHPGFGLSGLLVAVLGISVPLSYLLWKPVAVAVTFAGALRYVRRLLPPGGPRRTALVLILFGVMPAAPIVAWSGWGGKPRDYTFGFISGEMAASGYLWGYLMTAIAVFLMPLVLLGYERWRDGDGSRRALAIASAGAGLVCWLQPWQGGTLALIVLAVEGLRWRRTGVRPPLAVLAPVAATAVLAAYYLALSHGDDAWKLAGESNAAGSQPAWSWPWWAIVMVVAPLALPAALAYRLPAPSWQELAVRVWPFCALAVYLAPVGTFPYHAFQGLTIPLAILAVQGMLTVWRRPHAGAVVVLLAAMTLPGTAQRLQVAAHSVHTAGDPYFLFPGDAAALAWLERDPRPGAVLSEAYGGHVIPSRTGREVYVGAMSWTPDFSRRALAMNELFEGDMARARAQALVRRSGARFAFSDCRPGLHDLRPLLGPLIEDVVPFGCATVYVLRR